MLNKLADATVNITGSGSAAGVSGWTLASIISWAIGAILAVAGLIFFFMLLIGGIQWLTSGGDKGGTEAARGRITAALIGLIIVFAAWAIVTLLEGIFGWNLLNIDFGTIAAV